nr:cation-translocating P-type ATPase [Pandoraea communis]
MSAREAVVMGPRAPTRQGLSSENVERLRAKFGKNIIDSQQGHSWWNSARDVLSEPMFILLLAASAIYFVIGDAAEAFLLLGFVLAIVALTAAQSHRTARVLASLREMSAPRAQVLRDGERRLISAAELVPGDLVFVDEGARIPADGVVVEVHGLCVDESLLTGESEAVAKSAIDSEDNRLIFGSMVVQGQAWMTVSAIGAQTELGRIGKSLSTIEEGRSPLQIQTGLFVKRFAMLAILLCAALVVLYRWRYDSWLPGVLAGISLAMGILPEEIPVILTVFMALGARRIVAAGVLTRRMNAIETLGQTTVLCVDKTGTLTQNLMSVRVLWAGGRKQIIDANTRQIDESLKELLEYLVLASEIEPVDPMERAFHQTSRQFLRPAEHLHTDWTLVHEYELSSALPAMAHAWHAPERGHHAIACKGAPEAVCTLCRLDGAGSEAILAEAERMASSGLRVLGVAKANHPGSPWPTDPHAFDFSFVGLVGLMDPVRPDAAAAIADCRAAGIRVVMITGDYPSTARAIASEVGIDPRHLLTGQALNTMDDASLQNTLLTTSVFARIRPEQKLRLVEAFKARGDVVAMTGDGVNDAPALKSAHIGIAMGNRGAEAAREIASLILLRDDFAPIVTAIRLGRRIYDNLVQAISYTVAVHVPMVSAVMIPIVFGWPPLLGPVHIVFLELIINPVCSLVFENEPERDGLMRRPPRAGGIALLSSKAMIQCFAIGAIVALAVLGVYALLVYRGLDPIIARTYGFLSLVLGNVALIFVVRVMNHRHIVAGAGQRNPYLWLVLLATGAALTLLMTVPMFARLFSLTALLAR